MYQEPKVEGDDDGLAEQVELDGPRPVQAEPLQQVAAD